VFTLEERPLRRAYEAEKAKHAEAAAAAVEAERLRVESEADAERRRVESQKLLERLLAEQRRKLEGQSERLGADALHAERLQKERLERELTKHAAELKAAKAELQALKLAAAANQREAQATLEKMREKAEAAQRSLESESNRIRKELSATSSRLAAEKEGRQGAEAKATAEEKGRLAAEKELAAVLAKAQWNAACAEKAEAAHVATIKALKEELKEELKAAQKDKSPRHARPPKERGRGSRSLPGHASTRRWWRICWPRGCCSRPGTAACRLPVGMRSTSSGPGWWWAWTTEPACPGPDQQPRARQGGAQCPAIAPATFPPCGDTRYQVP
jgi:hypothetical protein